MGSSSEHLSDSFFTVIRCCAHTLPPYVFAWWRSGGACGVGSRAGQALRLSKWWRAHSSTTSQHPLPIPLTLTLTSPHSLGGQNRWI